MADDRLTDAAEVGDDRPRRGEREGYLVAVQDDVGETGREDGRAGLDRLAGDGS